MFHAKHSIYFKTSILIGLLRSRGQHSVLISFEKAHEESFEHRIILNKISINVLYVL